jgi:glycosyltransferase involved in cell wall biosynthesis
MMISAVVLTKNEEKNIKACLASLSFCGEIIIVDDNSADKTVKIAKKLGAKVYSRDMNEDYSAQSNFGMKKAKGEWILFVDADERVSGDLTDEIKLAVKNKDVDGYYLTRTNYMWGKWLKHGEIGAFKSIRLIRKGAGKWKRRVHPKFVTSGNILQLVNPIFHYPHQSMRRFVESINRWSSWHALANFEEGKHSGLIKIFFWPPLKFINNFVFKLGFLDGIYGFLLAMMMSFHSFLSWSKLWLMQRKIN